MKTYLVLIRGINVGGRNRVPMVQLRMHLEDLAFQDVRTYIASGNVILKAAESPEAVKERIEAMLPAKFTLDNGHIKVLLLTYPQLKSIVDHKPSNFGESPDTYYSDVIFLMNIGVDDALTVFQPKEGVDQIWGGQHVIYSQRLGAQRTKSRLGKIVGTPAYKSMTIRTWNTVIRLLKMMETVRK